MQLGSLLIGIAIGCLVTLAATFLWRPRRHRFTVQRAPASEPMTPPAPAPPRATPHRPPPAPLTLDSAVDENLLTDLLERNRRLDRDTTERVRRGTVGPVTEAAARAPQPAPEPAADASPAARLAHLSELNRRLENDARRRLSR